jgi:general secretion pathway protein G
MRQIGLAIHQYANVHKGRFPNMYHEQNLDTSWIFTLAPHLESVDEIRLCPEDRKRIEKDSGRLTSYALNGYLRKPTQAEVFVHPETASDFVSKLYDLPETHKTIVMFEAGDIVDQHFDHVDASEWFTEEYPTAEERWERIADEVGDERDTGEVAVDRHAGSVANYLYADGHVGVIPASQIHEWVAQGFNFAVPPRN